MPRVYNKISDEKQLEIIQYYFGNKNNSSSELSKLFNVKETTINSIINRGFKELEIFEIYESKMNHE